VLVSLWLVATGSWLVLIALVTIATRLRPPRPAQPALALHDEPPAVVSLLAGRVKRTGYPATLLDLAARGSFALAATGPDQVTCRIQPGPPGAGLAPYEARALAHVRLRADAAGFLPGAALGTGFDIGDKEFAEAFRAEVRADAAGRGLIRSRISAATLVLLGLGGLPAVAVAAVGLTRHGKSGLILLAFGYFAVLTWPAALRRGFRLTPAGRAALAQWLGFRLAVTGGKSRLTTAGALLAGGGDRRIGYAAALGAAPDAIRAFAADENAPWSSYGGTWRRVQIGAPDERFVPGNLLVGYALGWCGVFGLMALTIGHTAGLKWGLLFTLFPGCVAWGPAIWVVTSAERAGRLTDFAEFEGQIIRRWTDTRSTGGEDSSSYPVWCIAIDDGRQDRAWAVMITSAMYDSIRAGMVVRVQVNPRRNQLLELARAD
jgi:Predicted membrane protein (DUF2207)